MQVGTCAPLKKRRLVSRIFRGMQAGVFAPFDKTNVKFTDIQGYWSGYLYALGHERLSKDKVF